MSSQVSGRLQLRRRDPHLLATAATTLDPRRLARWIEAGRTGALEARRLLTIANNDRLAALRTTLEQSPSVSTPGEVDSFGATPDDTLECALHEQDLSSLLSDPATVELNNTIEFAGWETTTDSSHVLDDALEDEASVLTAVAMQSLAAEGFAAAEPHLDGEGALFVSGQRGDQQASIHFDGRGQLTVDVGVPGFDSSGDCHATRDALVRRLEGLGVTVEESQTVDHLDVAERRLAEDVEQAVARSLPGYTIRSIVEGDELQVIALPPREHRLEGGDR